MGFGDVYKRQDHFIPTAERSGLINELTDQVICEAIDHATEFVDADPDFSVAVNLSSTQLARPDIQRVITDALSQYDLVPQQLIIELTESILADQSVVERLTALHAVGVRLAIDDFGTGYSSLAYVQQLPVDTVKVDRAFLEGLEADGSGAPVLRAAVAMAHALDMTTTVEGIESVEQLAGLRRLSVDWGQGYLFAAPGPKEALLRQIKSSVAW